MAVPGSRVKNLSDRPRALKLLAWSRVFAPNAVHKLAGQGGPRTGQTASESQWVRLMGYPVPGQMPFVLLVTRQGVLHAAKLAATEGLAMVTVPPHQVVPHVSWAFGLPRLLLWARPARTAPAKDPPISKATCSGEASLGPAVHLRQVTVQFLSQSGLFLWTIHGKTGPCASEEPIPEQFCLRIGLKELQQRTGRYERVPHQSAGPLSVLRS